MEIKTCHRCKKPFPSEDGKVCCPQCLEAKRLAYEKLKAKPKEESTYEKNDYWSALGYGSNQRKQLQFVSICSYCGSILNKNGSCPNSRCPKDFG